MIHVARTNLRNIPRREHVSRPSRRLASGSSESRAEARMAISAMTLSSGQKPERNVKREMHDRFVGVWE